jgi:hypothetical protein
MQFHRGGEPAENIASGSLIPTHGALGGEIANYQRDEAKWHLFLFPTSYLSHLPM